MNKDVIYIEPDDDITDIITKLENSKEKIVALVPPKKASVFRSIVNIKLITKAGASAGKTVVLVTTDPSIVKLAAATRLPVTKNLQSAPVIPKNDGDGVEETVSKEEVFESTDEDGEEEVVAEEVETEEKEAEKTNPEDDSEDDAEDKKDKKKDAKKDKKASGKNSKLAWFKEHKKITIGLGVGVLVLIPVLIWALVFAPAVTVTLGVRTTKNNFSENVTFTTNLDEENASEGKFYLEEKKIESKSVVEFEATGKKNIGEKASGDLVVYKYFKKSGTVAINAGSSFSIGGLTFTSTKDASLSWSGDSQEECDNAGQASAITSGCMVAGRIAVTATEPGTAYNIAASSTGWNHVADVDGVYSDKAMTGGTDDFVAVVQKSDIDAALEKIQTESEATNKEKLLKSIDEEDPFIIETSFKQTTSDPVSSPALGEEVKEGQKANLSVVTTDSIYMIDKAKVEEFISEKAKLADNFKIYSINEPFIENFMKVDAGYIGKIKATYISGPKVTENGVVEIVRGKGLGSAQHDLKDAFDGISSITFETSFPWVNSVPNNENKITVVINVEE